jgi:hypothetical protein
VPLSKMALSAASPPAHEVMVERAAHDGSQHRYEAAEPILRDLAAGLQRNTLNEAWHEPFDHLLAHQVLAHIHARDACRRQPQIGHVVFAGMDSRPIRRTMAPKSRRARWLSAKCSQ